MGTAKRLRIAELERQRLERLAKGEDAPSIFRKPESERVYVVCGKCKHMIPESMANEHLKECQPGGVTCGKCKRHVDGPDFVAHIRTCDGKPKPIQEDVKG